MGGGGGGGGQECEDWLRDVERGKESVVTNRIWPV